MKTFFKIGSVLICVILGVALLTCCQKGNRFTCADVISRSEKQQRWLRSPVSNLILNPNAVDADAGAEDPRDMTTVPLSFGVKDASGKLVATYDDAFFLLEYACANGTGAELVQQISWDGCKGLSKVDNSSNGPLLSFTIPAGFGKEVQIRTTENLNIDYNDKKLYISCTIAEIPEGASLLYNPYVIDTIGHSAVYATWTAPGRYLINLQEAAIAGDITFLEGGNSTSVNLKTSDEGTFRITDFSIVRLTSGYHPAAEKASTEWAPYYMRSTLEYPNESSVETLDFFYGSYTVARKITPRSKSDLAFAGRIYGTCSYDSKNKALTFDNGTVRYVIYLRRKGTVEFYQSYEDLLSGENVLESADGALYWAFPSFGMVSTEDDSSSFYVSVSASAELSIEDLLSEGKDATSMTKAKKAYDALEEYWNAYIAENDVSDYITVIPKME